MFVPKQEWVTVTTGLAGSVPSSWTHKEQVSFVAGDGRANVIFSSEPLAATVDAKEYAETQQSLLESEFPGFIGRGQLEPFAIDGIEASGWFREFSWRPPDGEPVSQMQIYGARVGRGWTATATAHTADFEEFRQVFLDILRNLAVRAQ
jgi:hypothetical protein